MKDTKKEPGPREQAEPGTNADPLSQAKRNLSSDFFYYGNRYIARYRDGVCYYHPGLSTVEVAAVNHWAAKKGATIMNRCADADDFEAHEAGGERLIEALSFDANAELDKITQDIGVAAFKYLKKIVPLWNPLARHYHYADGHHGEPEACPDFECVHHHQLLADLDKDIFHGTMEDLTGVKAVQSPDNKTRRAFCPKCKKQTGQRWALLEGGENGLGWHCSQCEEVI